MRVPLRLGQDRRWARRRRQLNSRAFSFASGADLMKRHPKTVGGCGVAQVVGHRDQRLGDRRSGRLAVSPRSLDLLLDGRGHLGDLRLAGLPHPVDPVLGGGQVGATLEVSPDVFV
jgi:hypothetical protein